MKIEIVTLEEFNSFKKEILEALKPVTNSQTKQYLRSSEIRKMLNISAGTLQQMRINGTIPYSKIGTTIFYELDKIVEIFKENSRN